jgi:hypothetical protein
VACESPSSSGTARRRRLLDDPGGILDAAAARRIRAYLAWVGEQYGIDYHVVVGPIDGGSPERSALELFEQRATGRATGGKGLLLVADPSARVVRVEVGYALEPYVTDIAASRMLSDYLAPYFRSGDAAAGIEASIEALVDTLRPHLVAAAPTGAASGPSSGAAAAGDPTAAGGAPAAQDPARTTTAIGEGGHAATAPVEHQPRPQPLSGGGGASLDLLRRLPDDRLDDDTRAALRSILVPQPDPRRARDLEIALLHKGIYFQEAALYDEAWRRAARSGGFAPARLREIARQWDRPYEILVEEPLAVAYYLDSGALGPTFLRREPEGWIIDASEGARTIVYDYSNQGWYARDGDSRYLPLLRRALPLERVTLRGGGYAWTTE